MGLDEHESVYNQELKPQNFDKYFEDSRSCKYELNWYTSLACLSEKDSQIENSEQTKNVTVLDQGECGVIQTENSDITLDTHSDNTINHRSKRVIGGTPAKYGDNPWMIGIQIYSEKTMVWNGFCGGSMISEKWVLTAAHCIIIEDEEENRWENKASNFKIVAGDHKRFFTRRFEQERLAKKLIPHSNYMNSKTHDDDIGLIELDRELVRDKYVQPICLPSSGNPLPIGEEVTATGWGLLSPKDNLANTLQEAKVTVWTVEDCKLVQDDSITDKSFCAGVQFINDDVANQDVCSGDSGGPLIHNTEKAVQIGIVSHSRMKCSDKYDPNVYVDVAEYIEWIAEKTGMELKSIET